MSHLEAHAGYLSSLPEPHLSLPSKYCPQLLQLSYLIHHRWGPNRAPPQQKVPANCQILVTGLDLILERVARIRSCRREEVKSGLSEACYGNRLFWNSLVHGGILSPSCRGRPVIHESRQTKSQNTPAPHSFTQK